MDKAKQAGESSHVSVRGAPKAKSIIQLFIKSDILFVSSLDWLQGHSC